MLNAAMAREDASIRRCNVFRRLVQSGPRRESPNGANSYSVRVVKKPRSASRACKLPRNDGGMQSAVMRPRGLLRHRVPIALKETAAMNNIAIVSEHASPLALVGGVDSGGQNIYVANVARQLARSGHRVDVFTRRDNPLLPPIVHWKKNVRVIHVDAGPPRYIAKEELLPYMEQFGDSLAEFFRKQSRAYDVVHANFFMSGLASLNVKRELDVPLVITFHALGLVRRQHQRDADRFPDARFEIEATLVREADGIVAECPQDKIDMEELYGADEAKIAIIPCGFDPDEFWPIDRG